MSMIGLLDCNNFFVSCERLFRPDLANKPVAVLSSNDGCIVARSQEVKDMGIPMGLPLFKARELLDTSAITFFSSNFTLYRDISTRVMQILSQEVPSCEVYSIDEAFFTVPDTISVEDIHTLRHAVMRSTGIPVSIGVSATKTLAKAGSRFAKRGGEGVCLLTNALWESYASVTACGDIWNIGRQTAKKLQAQEVEFAAQFMNLPRAYIRKQFGVGGERIYDELHGISVYPVGEGVDEPKQSITSSRSFASVKRKRSEVEEAVAYHVAEVSRKLREEGLLATHLSVSIRASHYSDFAFRSGSLDVSLDTPTAQTQTLLRQALRLVEALYDPDVPYKKAGVIVRGLVPQSYVSRSLFEGETAIEDVDGVLDVLNERYGNGVVRFATSFHNSAGNSIAMRSPRYTSLWKDIPRVVAI